MAQLGYPHYTNIGIAIPLTGRPLVPYFTYAFQNLHPPMNSNVVYMTNFDHRHIPIPGPVADLRNWYVEQAIANDCKYLFFIDEDVTPPPHALRQLIFQMEHHPEAWAIGGVVCHKSKPTAPMIFRGNGNGPYWDWKLGEFFEVSGIGMGCFPPGHLIRLANGSWKPIESVREGEIVTSHTARERRVTKTMRRKYDGETIIVIPRMFNFPITMTAEHPVLAVKGEYCTNGMLRKPSSAHYSFGDYKPTWIEAKDLTEDHVVLYPIDQTISEPKILRISDCVSGLSTDENGRVFARNPNPTLKTHRLRDEIYISEDLLRLIGYYLAEGYCAANNLQFSFGAAEGDYVEDVQKIVLELFGVETSLVVENNRNGIDLTFSSKVITSWFLAQFGTGSDGKGLPQWVMELSPHLQIHLLRGYLRGDGHYDCRIGRICSNSKSHLLTLQLRDLMLRQGVIPSFREEETPGFRDDRVRYSLVISGPFAEELFQRLEPSLAFTKTRIAKAQGNLAWIQDGFAWLPIRKIMRQRYDGPVYNFSVADDESYVTSGFAVHNCTLLRVEPFKTLERPWFKTVDNMEAFWDGIPKAEVWTEDLYYCDKAIKAGGKIYADTSVLCDHWDMNTGQPTTLAPDSLPLRRATTKTKGQKKIVDLGCGEAKYETDEGDVLTVDVRDEVKPDYRADLRKLPFANEEFDIVYSSHVLEHFPRSDTSKVLDEWIRILKPDGELRLIVPNLEWAAEQIKLGAMNDDVLNVLYGAQTYGENFHQMGFTPPALTSMLKERGFRRIDVELVGYNLCVRAWRQPPEGLPGLGEPPKSVNGNGHRNGRHKLASKKKTTTKRK